jgi:hypothetical protein
MSAEPFGKEKKFAEPLHNHKILLTSDAQPFSTSGKNFGQKVMAGKYCA